MGGKWSLKALCEPWEPKWKAQAPKRATGPLREPKRPPGGHPGKRLARPKYLKNADKIGPNCQKIGKWAQTRGRMGMGAPYMG